MKFLEIWVALLLLPSFVLATNGIMKGDGSVENPWQIADYDDLKAIGKDAYLYSSHYVLTADIDASSSRNENCDDDGGCNGFASLGFFKDAADSLHFWGVIDGKGHSINNLYIWNPCHNHVGFISYLYGEVRNLNFDNLTVIGRLYTTDGSFYVGGVVGENYGYVHDIRVTKGFVQGLRYVGGIVGESTNPYNDESLNGGVLNNLYYEGQVSGNTSVGGILGKGELENSSAKVVVNGFGSKIGGLVGEGKVSSSQVEGSISLRQFSSSEKSSVHYVGGAIGDGKAVHILAKMNIYVPDARMVSVSHVGGIAGYAELVDHCVFWGRIEGHHYIGGLVGDLYTGYLYSEGSISYSYAFPSLIGLTNDDAEPSIVGGIVGDVRPSTKSFWAIEYSYVVEIGSTPRTDGAIIGNTSYTPSAEDVVSSYWNSETSGITLSSCGEGLTTAQMMQSVNFKGWIPCDTSDFIYDGQTKCCAWIFDEGKSFPRLSDFYFDQSFVAAKSTSGPIWTEAPVVQSLIDDGESYVGRWTGDAKLNEKRDSIYYFYQIGRLNAGDTIWGGFSYMAVPNLIKISSADELNRIGRHVAYPLIANYELTADIDLSSLKNFEPIGDTITPFVGTFDGKNHSISNLKIDRPKDSFVGLFAYTKYAIIKNVILRKPVVRGSWFVGTLVGEAYESVLERVVSYDVDVIGVRNVGGLVGAVVEGDVHMAASTGKVFGNERVSGVIGAVGGYADGDFSNLYSQSIVKGYSEVAGVLYFGGLYNMSLVNAYSASIVKGSKYVDAIANERDVKCTACYYDSTLASKSGYVDEGRSTFAMMEKSNYEGWDFDSVWTIDEGKSYPYFKGGKVSKPGEIEDDGTTALLAGLGTAERPYQINDYKELNLIGKYEFSPSAYYKIEKDIDAKYDSRHDNCVADEDCLGFEPLKRFSGVLIGNNKTIKNLYINRADEDSVGLFRSLAAGAKVTGLKLDSISISGKNYVGGLAGVDNGAVIDSVRLIVNVEGVDYVGGIVGKKAAGSVNRSYTKGYVVGRNDVGGILGSVANASLENSYSIANVKGDVNVGGLVGSAVKADFSKVYAVGNVDANSKWGNLVGTNSNSTYASAYYDKQVWLLGENGSGTPLPTQAMIAESSFKEFDFSKIWEIADSTYPYLKWSMDKVYPYVSDTTYIPMKGKGTDEDPFLVRNYEDLKKIGFGLYRLSASYKIVDDIDASESSEKEFVAIGQPRLKDSKHFGIGVLQDTVKQFTGHLWGNGKKIKNLFIRESEGGLIYDVGEIALVRDLELQNIVIEGGYGKGAIAYKNFGIVRNVSIRGNFVGGEQSGAIAYENLGEIDSCSVIVSATDDADFAGLSYYNEGVIQNSSVELAVDGAYRASGAVYENQGTIKHVVTSGKVEQSEGNGMTSVNLGLIEDCKSSIVMVNSEKQQSGFVVLNQGIIKGSAFTGSVKGKNYVGGFVYKNDSTIIQSYIKGDVECNSGYECAGFVYVNDGLIQNSYSSGNVANGAGFAYVNNGSITNSHATNSVVDGSGFIDQNSKLIENCHAVGKVTITRGSFGYGGFVKTNDSVIRNSFSDVEFVDGIFDSFPLPQVGGFAGVNSGLIERSYSKGSVFGSLDVGTFVGINVGTIQNIYAIGDLYRGPANASSWFNNKVNLLVGSQRGKISNAYAVGSVIDTDGTRMPFSSSWDSLSQNIYWNKDAVGGISFDFNNGTALCTEDMKKKSSFKGFDFDSVWIITEGNTYPMLRNVFSVPVAVLDTLKYADVSTMKKMLLDDLKKNDMILVKDDVVMLELDSASESLLNSLADLKSNSFDLKYRLGSVLDSDTLWGEYTVARVIIEKTQAVQVVRNKIASNLQVRVNLSMAELNFAIPYEGIAHIAIVDMQGKVVQKVKLGNRSAGFYFESVSLEKLPRGRYIAVLVLNARVVAKSQFAKF